MRRTNNPQRQEKVIQAMLGAVKLYGIHTVTHHKTATFVRMPLGLMACYFSEIDELLLEAFSRFTEIMFRQYQTSLNDVSDTPGVCRTTTDMIYSSQVAASGNMGLIYQFYVLANRKPLLKTIVQNWIQHSQQTPEQWFGPGTTHALDVFIKEMTPHLITNHRPLSREGILRTVEKVAG